MSAAIVCVFMNSSFSSAPRRFTYAILHSSTLTLVDSTPCHNSIHGPRPENLCASKTMLYHAPLLKQTHLKTHSSTVCSTLRVGFEQKAFGSFLLPSGGRFWKTFHCQVNVNNITSDKSALENWRNSQSNRKWPAFSSSSSRS